MHFFKPDTGYTLLPTYEKSVCSQNMTSPEAVSDAADSHRDFESLQTKPALNFWTRPLLLFKTNKFQLVTTGTTNIVFHILLLLFGLAVFLSILLVAYGVFLSYLNSASIPPVLSPTALTINTTPALTTDAILNVRRL